MSRIASKLLAGAALGASLLAAGGASANPSGHTYLVKVVTSFGTKFNDCYIFDAYGHLTVYGLGVLSWTSQSLTGPGNGSWQAVTPLSLAISNGAAIEFNGIALDSSGGYLRAQGNEEQDNQGNRDTYLITGPAVSSCGSPAALAARDGSNYRRH